MNIFWHLSLSMIGTVTWCSIFGTFPARKIKRQNLVSHLIKSVGSRHERITPPADSGSLQLHYCIYANYSRYLTNFMLYWIAELRETRSNPWTNTDKQILFLNKKIVHTALKNIQKFVAITFHHQIASAKKCNLKKYSIDNI